MKIIRYMTGPIQVNTYLVYDEESKKGCTFTNLMPLIIEEDNILLAYRNIKKNKGGHTSGVDGYTIKDAGKLSKDKLVKMVRSKLQNYHPNAVKRVEIPKPNGKTRPLGIPTIMDRIIQQCILQIMEPICEAKFYKHSYGFRPDRSAEHAIARCYNLMQLTNLHYVVDVDIKAFFDNVNHQKLMRQLWSIGIHDKNLLCVIKKMLKAEIVMPDNSRIQPSKGTPQGGILSPLLANVVLNELDWWISSQWENMPCPSIKNQINKNGTLNRGNAYKVLKKSRLKEMYIVRYADDFKIFCRNYKDAQRTYIAVHKWLKDRLHLDISEEKSGITNLRKRYTEFLGFKLKVKYKGVKYVVKSDMSDKAVKKQKEKLGNQINNIKHPKTTADLMNKINVYNSMVLGIHSYYGIATDISVSCSEIAYYVSNKMEDQRLNISKHGVTKYAMQYGKCAVTGEMITADQIHCHHKIPKRYGGTDAYTNLIIVSKAIHALIHATNEDVINLHKHCIKDKGMLEKLNTLRILANNKPITI